MGHRRPRLRPPPPPPTHPYPSYPERANFSYISLQDMTNRLQCLHETQKVG